MARERLEVTWVSYGRWSHLVSVFSTGTLPIPCYDVCARYTPADRSLPSRTAWTSAQSFTNSDPQQFAISRPRAARYRADVLSFPPATLEFSV